MSAANAGPRRSLLWLQGLGCGAVLAVSPAGAVLAAMLLLPGALAAVLDREPGRPTTRIVLCWSLAGLVSPALRFCADGAGFDAMAHTLSRPMSFVEAWIASGAGWLAAEVLPPAIAWWLNARDRRQIAALERRKAELAAEWVSPAS